MERKTPLYDTHVAAGGKIVPFGGYLLPVQYATGIMKEHKAVREAAGLFDVSHMGELFVQGQNALKYLNFLLTNDFTNLQIGRIRYSPMCYEDGGIVDDLLVYKCDENKYLLVVNASNKDKDYEWMQKQAIDGMTIEDRSDSYCQVALQGPLARKILEKVTPDAQIPKKYYSFVEAGTVAGIPCIISRTGYTGEDGFEIYGKAEDAATIWNALMEAGEAEGLIPCGLGCRDTLRLEAGMPLYGHELSAEITPKEAGLSMFVKEEKAGGFIGKDGLLNAPKKKRIGLALTVRGIAREGADVFVGDEIVGHVTSGTSSPTLGKAIAMATVEANAEGPYEIEVRGKRLAAEQVPLPFYKRAK